MKEMVYRDNRNTINVLSYGVKDNYKYCILNLGTHPTAYVELPDGHKYYKKDYIDVEEHIDVHGGVTFASQGVLNKKGLEQISKEEADFIGTGWWIGWDYAHYGDYVGMVLSEPGKKYTTEEIFEDVCDVIRQLKEVSQ